MMKKIFTLISIALLVSVSLTGYAQDPCQHFSVEILSNTVSKQYPTPEDNFLYFNTCQGSTNKFYVNPNFYENNTQGYTQTNANTVFTWKFTSTENTYNLTGDTVEIPFQLFNGWDVRLDAVDVNNCPVDLMQTARIRVAADPLQRIEPVAPICPGDTIYLSISYDPSTSAFIYVEPQESDPNLLQIVVDPTFLPDGSGVTYHSSVVYDIFETNSVLTNISDFIRIAAELEHTYIGDLRIWLTAPNNASVELKSYPGGTSTKFGEPRGCGAGVDGCSNTACSMQVGNCYYYGWTPTSTYGNVLNQSNWVTPSWYFNCPEGTYTQSSSAQHVYGAPMILGQPPLRDYQPSGSFNSLLGTPLNGTWTLWVQDNLGLDNGWICSWSIELASHLIPALWSYIVDLDTVISLNDCITALDKHTLMVTNTVPSIDSCYRFAIVDEYGCYWDSCFVLTTANPYKPVLGPDLTYCDETSITIGPNIDDPYSETAVFEWTSHVGEANHGSHNQMITITDSGQFVVEMWMNYLNDSLRCKSLDTILIKKWNAVHIYPQAFLHESCTPLSFRLENSTVLTYNGTTVNGSDFLYYHWTITDNNGKIIFESNEVSPAYTIYEVGFYDVKLEAVTEHGCEDLLECIECLKVYPQPDVDFLPILIGDSLSEVAALALQNFTPDPVVISISNGDKVLFFNTSDSTYRGEGNGDFTWTFGDGEENSTDWSPTHTYSNWGDFEVVFSLATDQGCVSTRSHIVIVEEELEFPNVITPNGDGINDVFAIKNLNTNINPDDIYHYRTNNITIYDRWGKKVYSADNYNTYMNKEGQLIVGDKYFDGSGFSDGIYYFTFSYRSHYYNKESNFHGSFTILRGGK